MLDLIEQGSTWSEIVMLAKELQAAGATIINTGIGWHEARVPTIATKVPRAGFAWVTEKMMQEKVSTSKKRNAVSAKCSCVIVVGICFYFVHFLFLLSFL